MEWMFIHGGTTQNIELYNCSAMPAQEWTVKYGIKHPQAGALSLAYGLLIELIYIPCLIVIRSKEFYAHSCFKIMFFLGLIDMAAISVNSILHGFLLIDGAVFCSYPDLIFVAGCVGLGLWGGACFICLILVINRILDIMKYKPHLVDSIFSNTKTNLMIATAICYGAYITFFTPPILFTSKYNAWFFDPFIYENRGSEYQSPLHTANNFFIVGCTCLLYGVFCATLGNRLRAALADTNTSRRVHNQIFIQSTVICMANFAASMIYVIMQLIPTPNWVIILGHISWQAGHGCPAIIYLVMNRTIRNGVLQLLHLKSFAERFYNANTHTKSHVAPSHTEDRH